MVTILTLLFLVSLVCLVVGLIKPTLFKRFLKENVTRKKVGMIFGISTFVLFIAIGVVNPNKNSESNTAASSTTPEKTEQATAPVQSKTDQQILEEKVAATVGNAGSLTSKLEYQGLEIEKS